MNGCTHKLILGPPFFNLYINDLPTIPKSGSLESFVDDSRLYLSFQMLLRLPKDFHVTLLGKEVTPSNSARDLGIEMDATLSFDEHITNTVSYCFASLCQINRIKHLFDSKSLENVIHALVFSQLFYCSPVWSSTSKKNVSKLQCLEFCCKSCNTCPEGLKLASWYKSAAGQRSFPYRSITMWNSMPTAITDCNNLAMFKRKLKVIFSVCIFQIVNCIIIRWLLYIHKLGLNALLL